MHTGLWAVALRATNRKMCKVTLCHCLSDTSSLKIDVQFSSVVIMSEAQFELTPTLLYVNGTPVVPIRRLLDYLLTWEWISHDQLKLWITDALSVRFTTSTKVEYCRQIINTLESSGLIKRAVHNRDIYWLLDQRGVQYLAKRYGKPLTGTNRLIYRKSLPKHFQHDQDLLNAIKHFLSHVRATKGCRLVRMHSELELRSRFGNKPVQCTDSEGRHYSRRVVFDWYTELIYRKRPLRYLWLYDHDGNEREPRLTRNFLIPPLEFIHSKHFLEIGKKPVRIIWLSSATHVRLGNIKHKLQDIGSQRQARRSHDDSRNYVLTTYREFMECNPLSEAIWHQPTVDEPITLLTS